jgi:predicted amidophosphoribosyltransferase
LRNYRYMETGICAMCGKDVKLDDREGRVVCEGCEKATDNCTCVKDDLDTRHESSMRTGAMREGTSAEWRADPKDGHSAEV